MLIGALLGGRRFGRCRRAATAIEFALVFPPFLMLSLAFIDLANYVNAIRAVSRIAVLQAQQVSMFKRELTSDDSEIIGQTAIVSIPSLGVNYKDYIDSTVAQISFKPVSDTVAASYANEDGSCLVESGCDVKAKVDWTIAWHNKPDWVRSCDPVTLVPGPSQNNLESIPSNAADLTQRGLGSVLVVDVRYRFQPMFWFKQFGYMTIVRQAIAVPRYLLSVDLGKDLIDQSHKHWQYKLCP